MNETDSLKKKHGQTSSITQQVSRSTRSMALLLTGPAIIGVIVMVMFAAGYHRMIRRMSQAADLKPVVKSQIPEELFSVAAGRISFAESSLDESIEVINRQIDVLLADSRGEGKLQLTVARRTMGTLEQYVHQVRDGMEEGKPIAQMEAVVDEVRDVGTLVNDMLEDFIGSEITSAAETNARLRLILLVSAVAEIGLLLLALWRTRVATGRLSASIHSSILNLEQIVRRLAGGNLQERVDGIDVEELQELGEQINIMADRLDNLIEQNRREQIHLAKSEMRTLQAQIHPHFLYNTLDTIVWQAESGKGEEVIRLTEALSDFFRISLSHGADWIPLEQEIQHVKAYLSIQKIRYRDILNYEVAVDAERPQEIYMVKLLLQPLVENAIYHGIKNKRGGGTILVQVKQAENRLEFRVEDTGRGMSPEELERVKKSLEEDPALVLPAQDGSGFGLRNVNMRIRLYYQQEEALHIRSDHRGTVVTFRLPCKTRELIAREMTTEAILGGGSDS